MLGWYEMSMHVVDVCMDLGLGGCVAFMDGLPPRGILLLVMLNGIQIWKDSGQALH
jgi:hypothetical protein